jgi:hypothetical protein
LINYIKKIIKEEDNYQYTLLYVRSKYMPLGDSVDRSLSYIIELIKKYNLSINLKAFSGEPNVHSKYGYLSYIVDSWPSLVLLTRDGLNKLITGTKLYSEDIHIFGYKKLRKMYISRWNYSTWKTIYGLTGPNEPHIYYGLVAYSEDRKEGIEYNKENYLNWFIDLKLFKEKII